MIISLINKPAWREGSLWFVIPADLQAAVVPWIKYRLPEVSSTSDRKAYRSSITKKGLDCKYSEPIPASSCGIYFDFYALYGEWRVGYRGTGHTEQLKAAILRAIEEYADVKKAIDEAELVTD